MNFVFIANAAVGSGLSGSDRIFMELARNWSHKNSKIMICVWEDGYEMCKRESITESLPNISFNKWFIGPVTKLPFIINYIYRIFSGVYFAFTRVYPLSEEHSYIYSCSDFWQDAIPSLILKFRYPKAQLIGSFYLAAPNPFKGFTEIGKVKLPSIKGIVYFMQQLPIYWLFKNYAEYIFVTSDPDTKRFPSQDKRGHCLIIKGGVDLQKINEWKEKIGIVDKKYEAVFLGRFHPQKGVLELIDIWKKVTDIMPNAKLVMMGDGPLMSEVKEKVHSLGLEKNIILTGYLFDGEEKYRYFSQSKIALHPAVYDSGGMAAAEAMAWDIPAISFDLEALKTYYPQGMIKIPFGNIAAFADAIVELITNPQKYAEVQQQAKNLIENDWDWGKRSESILAHLHSH